MSVATDVLLSSNPSLSSPGAALPAVSLAEGKMAGVAFSELLGEQLATEDPLGQASATNLLSRGVAAEPTSLADSGKALPLIDSAAASNAPADLEALPSTAALDHLDDLTGWGQAPTYVASDMTEPVPVGLPLPVAVAPLDSPPLNDSLLSKGKPGEAPSPVSTGSLPGNLTLEVRAAVPVAESVGEPGFEALLQAQAVAEDGQGQESEWPLSEEDTRVGKLTSLPQLLAAQNANLTQRGVLPTLAGQPLNMQQGAWGEALVDRVMLLSSQNLKAADIILNPAELGRLEVRIQMNQEQAHVSFASASPMVREALESQMPRLRELFEQQGLNLAQGDVSGQSAFSGGGRGQPGEQPAAGSDAPAISGGRDEAVADSPTLMARALVDYYA